MVAYYAHQHGSGHSNCAQLFASVSPQDILVFSSYPYIYSSNIQIVHLPSEDPDGSGAPPGYYEQPAYLHYSPVGQRSIQERSALLLSKCWQHSVKLMIIDVSVEIAALSRASSIPYAYVRLPGNRIDEAHLQAFRGAVFILAYYPEALEPAETEQWVRDKTIYLGFFGRYDAVTDFRKPGKLEKIIVLTGQGGNERLRTTLPNIISRFRSATIDVFGNLEAEKGYDHVNYHGFLPELKPYIDSADVVVTNCGLNAISELLHLKKVVIAVPEDRPYHEQKMFERQLVGHRLVSPLDFALHNTDQDILNFIADPSDYLKGKKLSCFVKRLINAETLWNINIHE